MLEDLITKTVQDAVKEALKEIPSSNHPQVMTVKQLASYLNMSVAWVYTSIGELPSFNLGTRILFNKEDIDKWRLEKTGEKVQKVNKRPAKTNYDNGLRIVE